MAGLVYCSGHIIQKERNIELVFDYVGARGSRALECKGWLPTPMPLKDRSQFTLMA